MTKGEHWQILTKEGCNDSMGDVLELAIDSTLVAMSDKGHDVDYGVVASAVYDAYESLPGAATLLIVDPCLALVKVVRPWWSPKHILSERALVRYTSGDFENAVQGLKGYADFLGINQIVLGTAAQLREEAYCKVLVKLGFRRVGYEMTYIKEGP